MKLLEFFVLFGSLAVQSLARTGPVPSNRVATLRKVAACPAGEIRKTCRSKCEPTCFSNAKCATTCSANAVCTCQDGFVRHEGICIPFAACQFFAKPTKKTQQRQVTKSPIKKTKPTKSTKSPQKRKGTTKAKPATPPPDVIIKPAHPPPSCGRGQAFTLCVCDASCSTGKVCKSCKSGCGCFRNFVRDASGDCIHFEECPSPRLSTKPMAIIDLTDEKPGGSQAEGFKTLILTSDNFHARIPQQEAEEFLRQMNTRALANVSHMLDHKTERHKLASAILANSINMRHFMTTQTASTPPSRRQPFTDIFTTIGNEFFSTKHPSLTRKARRLRKRKHTLHGRRRHFSLLNSLLKFSRAKEVNDKIDNVPEPEEKVRHILPKMVKGPLPPANTELSEPVHKESLKGKVIKSSSSPGIKPQTLPIAFGPTEIGAPAAKPPSVHLHGPTPPALVKRLREKGRGMPPGQTPPSFGPPAMTPFVFFREKRIRRRQRKLDELRSKLPFLRRDTN